MLTTGNISLGPFVGLLDSMKNTNTSLRVITLKIFFRPVFNESEPINVTFGLNLQQIVDLVSFPCIMQIEVGDNDAKIAYFYQDEKNQLLTTCMWFNLVRNSLLRKNKGKSIDHIWGSQLQRPS